MTGKKTVISSTIDAISEIFLPIVNLFTAAGILMGILAILTTTNALSSDGETFLVLSAMAGSVFYFLPILLAFTAAKKFGANPFTTVVIAGVLLYPAIITAMEAGTAVRFFGLPLMSVLYRSSVIPIIMAAWLLAYTERFLGKVLPDIIKGFFTPMLSILFVGTVTLMVFGPAGAVIGNMLAAGYGFAYSASPIIAGFLIGVIAQPLVIFGLHWGLLLVGMNNIAVNGYDTVMALLGPPVLAQSGAAFAVMVKSKNNAFRAVCASAGISAFFGITEPALYGVNLPRKKPMFGVCIGGGIGSALAGFSGVYASIFVFPSIVTLPVFLGDGFVLYVLACLMAVLVSFLFTFFAKFEVDIEVTLMPRK